MVKLGRPMREEGSAGQRTAKGLLRAAFVRSGESEFSGFVCDPSDPNRKSEPTVGCWARAARAGLRRGCRRLVDTDETAGGKFAG